MKNLYLPLAGLLLAAPAAYAQQPWQPFRPGLSYQYSEAATPGDTTHVLRLGAGTLAPGSTDSLYTFNARTGRGTGTGSCGRFRRLLPDNLFGATLRTQPRGVFALGAANGRTLTLRPRTALNQSWPTGLPGLAARVTARATALVLNATAPDSVATITFSDGRTLRLSKSYGLLDGPSLDSYLNGRNARRALTLSALPERQLGTPLTGPHAIFNFAPGDYFQRITESDTHAGGLCYKQWSQDSVLTRAVSRTGDSLIYTIRTWQVGRGYGAPGAPAGLCSSASTVQTSSYVRTLVVSATKSGPNALTSFYVYRVGTASGDDLNYRFTRPMWRGTSLGGRPEYMVEQNSPTCSGAPADSISFGTIPDFYSVNRFSPGLGMTYDNFTGIYNQDVTTMTAFRKGTAAWGPLFTRKTLLATLAARDGRAAATTTVAPNPFADELTVAFVLAGPQPVGATLYDALGRAVRAAAPTPLAAGSRQLRLPTADLPAGLYTLHLEFGGTGQREVLKVVK